MFFSKPESDYGGSRQSLRPASVNEVKPPAPAPKPLSLRMHPKDQQVVSFGDLARSHEEPPFGDSRLKMVPVEDTLAIDQGLGQTSKSKGTSELTPIGKLPREDDLAFI